MSKFPETKFWLRTGHINQKRHFDLSEEEKANIFNCNGTKEQHPCKNPVYRCNDCGNFGCDQDFIDKCSAQGFKNDKCLHCGAIGTRVPIMKNEYNKYVEEFMREVPVIEE